ncbi:MAG: FtsB family cell division protein [Bacteroidia bacterium]
MKLPFGYTFEYKFKWQHLKNRYFIVSFLLFLHLLITEETNVFQLISERREIKRVEKENEQKREEIKQTKKAVAELTTDKVYLEKFAREQYFMKKNDEDIFIFVEK